MANGCGFALMAPFKLQAQRQQFEGGQAHAAHDSGGLPAGPVASGRSDGRIRQPSAAPQPPAPQL